MSWVSYTKLKTLCDGLRSKMVSNEFLLANSDKSKGVHVNLGGQDGLMTLSPITEDGVTPAALWVTDSEANNATELTGGTLSYVTDVGESGEDYTSLSLVGGVVNVSGKSGAQRRITNVATPTGDNDVANKKYVDDNAGGNTPYSYSKYLNLTKTASELVTSEYSEIADLTSVLPSNYKGIAIISFLLTCNGECQFDSKITITEPSSVSVITPYGRVPFNNSVSMSGSVTIPFTFTNNGTNSYKLYAKVSATQKLTFMDARISIYGHKMT